MHPVWVDASALIEGYKRGESVFAMARRHGVSRSVVHRGLLDLGLQPRTQREAQLLRQAAMTPDERKAQATAAHAALRGSKRAPDSIEAMLRSAQGTCRSDNERFVLELLRSHGVEAVPHFVLRVGDESCTLDLAIVDRRLGIEVRGGNWHTSPRKVVQDARRARLVAAAGWRSVPLRVRRIADVPLDLRDILFQCSVIAA
jgi:very-short-patch-repair endonuclease